MQRILEFKGKHRFLSNFYPAEVSLPQVKLKGKTFPVLVYPTVEHAYQAAKFPEGDKDREFLAVFLPASRAGEAKRMGQEAPLPADWDSRKFDIMEYLLHQKFAHPSLRQLLLDTGESELVEGNTWNDRIWGVDLKTGKGDNHLGKLLMKVRASLPR